jgi:hypothetical protein
LTTVSKTTAEARVLLEKFILYYCTSSGNRFEMRRDGLADFQSPSMCGTEFLTDFLQIMLADFIVKYG